MSTGRVFFFPPPSQRKEANICVRIHSYPEPESRTERLAHPPPPTNPIVYTHPHFYTPEDRELRFLFPTATCTLCFRVKNS